jgi:hypothetical protein
VSLCALQSRFNIITKEVYYGRGLDQPIPDPDFNQVQSEELDPAASVLFFTLSQELPLLH